MEDISGGISDAISDDIKHPALMRESSLKNCTLFNKFLEKHPVVFSYSDSNCSVSGLFTNECWRRIWTVLVLVCFDARDFNYILSPTTFERENMKIVGNHHLKFVKLFGKKIDPNVEDDYSDFKAVAKLIEELVAPYGPVTDVVKFVSLLKEDRPTKPTEPYRKALIKCNYALLSDVLRQDFILKQLDDGRLKSYNKYAALEALGSYLSPGVGGVGGGGVWQSAVTMNKGYLTDIYHFRVYQRTYSEWMRYTRNAMIHLRDGPRFYTSGQSLRTVTCCYGALIYNLQAKLFATGALKTPELYLYQPPAY